METISSPRRYTDAEKQALIEQWQQSGKNKMAFCKENSVSYYSFNDWIKRRNKKPKSKPAFVPLKVKYGPEKVFAELILKNGARLTLHQAVEASYLALLLK